MSTPQPAQVFHVGEYLEDELIARGFDCVRLADATGTDANDWVRIVQQKAGMLGKQAEALERIGWGSALMWLALNHRWNARNR